MKLVKKVTAGTFLAIGFICLMVSVSILFEPEPDEDDRSAAMGGMAFGVPSLALGGWIIWNMRRKHEKETQERLQTAFFQVLKQGQGHVTALRFAMAANVTGEEARVYLDERAKVYQANFNVSDEGDVSYYFPMSAGDSKTIAPAPTTELTFDVILEAVPDYKQREVIKVVQRLTGLSWKEVKALVRDVPQPIQKRANRETAKAFRKELEAVGAQVSLVLN